MMPKKTVRLPVFVFIILVSIVTGDQVPRPCHDRNNRYQQRGEQGIDRERDHARAERHVTRAGQ